MPVQLTLPWDMQGSRSRDDFITVPGNEAAVHFIDSWPDWPAPAALHGPSGCGKSHLVAVWAARADAAVLKASALDRETIAGIAADRPVAVEDIDAAPAQAERDAALFALFERLCPLLLTGRAAPGDWGTVLPDLASRYAALLAFPLWAPDDTLLAGLARKLFTDRQLAVPDAVVMRMIHSLERAPAAIRDFVAEADARALAQKRPVNLALIREMLDGPAP